MGGCAAMQCGRAVSLRKASNLLEDVQQRVEEILERIVSGGYTLSQVYNGDEPFMLYAATPKIEYVSISAYRETALEGAEKARFIRFLFASADGEMCPTFNTIKCGSSNAR